MMEHMNHRRRSGSTNGLKTAFLLGGLPALILLVGRVVGGSTGLLVALVALGINGVAYFYSDNSPYGRCGRSRLVPSRHRGYTRSSPN